MEVFHKTFEVSRVKSVVITALTLAALAGCSLPGENVNAAPTTSSSSAEAYPSPPNTFDVTPNATPNVPPPHSAAPTPERQRDDAILAEACALYRTAASAAGRYQEQIDDGIGSKIGQLESEYNAMFNRTPSAENGPNMFNYAMIQACPDAYPPAKNLPQKALG